MAKKQSADPAARMTPAEAQVVAESLWADLVHHDALPRFCLLLRWLAYNATDDERETLYVTTEGSCAPYINGVDEAILEQMRRALDGLKKGAAR